MENGGVISHASGPAYQLEIAHVLFMDIVGYSLLTMDVQRTAICDLQEIVRNTSEFIQAQDSDALIRLPTGDGMALAFFGDPTTPVRCARRIWEALRARADLPLRMGVHTGPVYRMADINTNANIAGGGINMAQRVMDGGDAGHILVSQAMAETLRQLSEWRQYLHDLGEIEVKHGVRLHVFNLHSPDFGNSELPTRLQPHTPGHAAAGEIPFDPWKPVAPPVFVGRRSVLARLNSALDEGRSVSLVGDWRIGKTSVLKTNFQALSGGARVARMLNGNDREGSSIADFVECATGKKAGATPDSAADALSAWSHQNGKPGLLPVLLVDEFDKLIARFDHRFFERLRGMLDYLCLIVSSRRELDRIYQELGRTSPFHNRLELCWIGLLEPEAAAELAERSAAEERRAVIREWAGRHPFFIQLCGRKLSDSLRFGESIEQAKEAFFAEGASRLRELWMTLAPHDRDILRESLQTPQVNAASLRRRGLLTEEGRPFGRLLVEWLQGENP